MYFSEAKVGDEVWDLVLGKGKIVGLFPNKSKMIDVEFPETEQIGSAAVILGYSLGGKNWHLEQHQRLFYYEERPVMILKEDWKLTNDDEFAIFCDMWFADNTGAKTYKTITFLRQLHREKNPAEKIKIGKSEYCGDDIETEEEYPTITKIWTADIPQPDIQKPLNHCYISIEGQIHRIKWQFYSISDKNDKQIPNIIRRLNKIEAKLEPDFRLKKEYRE